MRIFILTKHLTSSIKMDLQFEKENPEIGVGETELVE
jgi:hypothetical protein